jgi:hypothetical protein
MMSLIKMSIVGFVLGLLASVMARLVGDGSPASYVVFTAVWLVVLLLLQRREWRRIHRSPGGDGSTG